MAPTDRAPLACPLPNEHPTPKDPRVIRHAVHYFLGLLAVGLLAFYVVGCASPRPSDLTPAEVRWLNDNLK